MTRESLRTFVLLFAVTGLGFLNYFSGYDQPPYFFWDENYHVASAQKYLHGVFFMEPHPPLGKMLIALGEYLLHPNAASDQFLRTNYGLGSDLPPGFSFRGYRFFPVLFATLTAPLLYLLGLVLTGSAIFSALLAGLYLFDNALIVHLRGAMLEGPQLFFMVLALLLYFLAEREAQTMRRRAFSIGFGIALGCAVSVKVNAAVLVAMYLWSALVGRQAVRALVESILLGCAGFLAVFLLFWQLHFSIAKTIVRELPSEGYYAASSSYKAVLDGTREAGVGDYFLMLRDSFRYAKKYERDVPLLDLCKSDETGSPLFLWPFGGRSINYRWERRDGLTRYLYLQVNPAVWAVGLCGLLCGSIVCGARLFFPQRITLRRGPEIAAFLMLYVGYLVAIGSLPRVMYLYHYFIPLLFSLILFVLALGEIDRLGRFVLNDKRKLDLCAVLITLVAAVFYLYSPLTYYRPVSNDWVQRRALLSFWDLRCVDCRLTNFLARPCAKEAK